MLRITVAPLTFRLRAVRAGRAPSRAATAIAILAGAIAAAPTSASAATAVDVTASPIERTLPMKATSARIAVKNTGTKRLTGLTLSVRPIAGVRVTVPRAKKGRTTRALTPLKAGATTTVTVRLQRLKGGPKRGAVTARVQRKGKTLSSARLQFGVPPTNPNTLAGRYFWGSTYTINGIRQETLYFAGDGLVYTDDAEGAWPTCAAESKECRPYQYVATGNKLTIDGKPATLTGHRIEYDGSRYSEFVAPAVGTRWAGTLTYANSSGICPLYCSYYTEHLQFNADGTFIRSAVASGTGPVVDWASVPPDSKGTYEVRADKMLRLAFADGKERIETVGVYVGDDGKPKSPMEGLILDGDGYFDISDK